MHTRRQIIARKRAGSVSSFVCVYTCVRLTTTMGAQQQMKSDIVRARRHGRRRRRRRDAYIYILYICICI